MTGRQYDPLKAEKLIAEILAELKALGAAVRRLEAHQVSSRLTPDTEGDQ